MKHNRHMNFQHWHVINAGLVSYDVLCINLAYFFALWFRFDCRFSAIPEGYMDAFLKFAPVYTIFCVIVFWRVRLYRSIWRFASYSELLRTAMASVVSCLFQMIGITCLFGRMPVSYYIFGALMQFLGILGIRFSYRFVLLLRSRQKKNMERYHAKHIMLIGAGAGGRMIIRDLRKSDKMMDEICCIIDDNPNKWKRFIEGIPVVGGRDSILLNVRRYHIDKIFFAIPTATPEEKRDILNICKETGCELKSLPGIYQILDGTVTVDSMKEVSVEDLLGREQIQVDMEDIFRHLSGKTILVTGGGGSIGSELCRQIASHTPKQLIIFDIYENNAYEIEQELRKNYPELNLLVLIGSVRDSRRVCQVFERYRPEIVYHAAAHKHVPLMETSPNEAVKNNAVGTYKTAYAAAMYGCQRFVLISTDKAVNPTNIMGATKRLCEMIVQTFDRMIKNGMVRELRPLYAHAEDENDILSRVRRKQVVPCTEFVAVRFGNVLGSNGSVIPLFKKQIAEGGPVTVTHPDIIRYFMTIPEAVSLVLQAGTYAKGGEIFVLDMGSPVKIDTLARNLIHLSGYKPDVDIKIEYTGLRPGEKLYEEKLMEEEGMKTTPNHLIHIGSPISFDEEEFLKSLESLMKAAYEDRDDLRYLISQMVPTYHPAGAHGSEEKGSAYEELLKSMREKEEAALEAAATKEQ